MIRDETGETQRARLALYDALDLASAVVIGLPGARERYIQARIAALGAFPEGSRQAEGLAAVLDHVGDMARGVTV